jgi:hypothetical protein
MAQATPITVSQIHQEEKVELEQRNAELQAALELERQQAAPTATATAAATDSVGGVFAAMISLAAAYWSKLSIKQRRRRWFCFITCVVLIITTAVLVDQSNKQRWKRRWQRSGQTSSTAQRCFGFGKSHTLASLDRDSRDGGEQLGRCVQHNRSLPICVCADRRGAKSPTSASDATADKRMATASPLLCAVARGYFFGGG